MCSCWDRAAISGAMRFDFFSADAATMRVDRRMLECVRVCV